MITRSLIVLLLVGILAVLGLAGCSGDNNTAALDSSQRGTVHVMLAGSRSAQPVPVELNMLFTRIDLLTADADLDYQFPDDWQLPFGPISPTIPIPLIDRPTAIDFILGSLPGGYSEMTIADVPCGIYQQLRLQLDPTLATVVQQLDLPFDQQSLTALIPISGGMAVEPGETITLFVNLLLEKAEVVPNQ